MITEIERKTIDASKIFLSGSVRTHSKNYDDPDRNVNTVNMEILAYDEDDEVKIGGLEMNIITNVYSDDIIFSLDCHSQALLDMGDHILDLNHGLLKKKIQKILNTCDYVSQIIYLHDITILEQYRGNKLFTAIVENVIENFAYPTHSLFIFKSFPLEYSGSVTDDNRKEFNKAQKNLNKYYAKLGFIPLGKNYFGWNCDREINI